MAIQNNFPAIRPSLNLDFANTKSLDPRITFSRASSATYLNANGVMKTAPSGVARFDHNPVTGESLGLLIEEQRTNLLTYSEQFDNAAWGLLGGADVALTANAVTAPDGTTTADKLYEATTNTAFHGIQIATAPTVTAGSTVTASVFLKAAERSFARIQVIDGVTTANTFYAYFDLSGSGSASSISVGGAATAGSAVIQNVGNGWYRASVSGVTGVSDTRPKIAVYLQTALIGSANYTGTVGSGVYIWGAQLEAGSFPTSYIKTEAAQATRSADVASMTGTNFSTWYNQTEGTFVAEADILTRSKTCIVLDIVGAGAVFGTTAYIASSMTQIGVLPDTAPVSMNSLVSTSVSSYTAAVGMQANNTVAAVNGTLATVDTICAMPASATTLTIGGAGWASGAALNGRIARVTYYPKRLSNTNLQALSGA